MTPPLEIEFEVGCSPDHAFDVWARRTDMWWPRTHSVSGDPGLTVTIEPHAGGRIFERTPSGNEHDWGRVVDWEPPHRLTYLWHIAWEEEHATQVVVTFTAQEGGTLVRIEHSGWETFAEQANEMRDRNQAGWTAVIGAFSTAAHSAAA